MLRILIIYLCFVSIVFTEEKNLRKEIQILKAEIAKIKEQVKRTSIWTMPKSKYTILDDLMREERKDLLLPFGKSAKSEIEIEILSSKDTIIGIRQNKNKTVDDGNEIYDYYTIVVNIVKYKYKRSDGKTVIGKGRIKLHYDKHHNYRLDKVENDTYKEKYTISDKK